MCNWQKYSSELYVERKKELDDLLKWADSAPVSKQVKSLVAPPGAGKTWFLRAVQEKLEQCVTKDAPPEWLVIFCDVPRLVNRDQSVGTLNTNAIFDWLEEIQKDASRFCTKVRPIDRSLVEIATPIQELVKDLCDECILQHPVVVLVDGLDEVSPDQAAKIEWVILEQFIGKQCIRMVIAHRDEYTLKNPLKNHAKRFFLSSPPSVEEQFRRFKKQFYANATHLTEANLDSFKSSLEHYKWDHPYINAFLFDRALARGGSDITKLLTADDLRDCLFAVVERRDENNKPRHGELEEQTFDCLKRIATGLPDNWTALGLQQLRLKLDDRGPVDWLFNQGIIFNHPVTQRYQLADGIRELARDLVERGG